MTAAARRRSTDPFRDPSSYMRLTSELTPLNQDGPDDNPVFPSRMMASCPAGHTWPVALAWAVMDVPGQPPSVTMRVPLGHPKYCMVCFIQQARSVAYTALQHLRREGGQ